MHSAAFQTRVQVEDYQFVERSCVNSLDRTTKETRSLPRKAPRRAARLKRKSPEWWQLPGTST